eukprot:TRINITY_DN47452_c0_g1_i1.p1 TRINITY_DN47452_c0_g1~~TRINITY_DN47452_c0_g1_i1.p1  ORF type:complete len:166 (-),score=7.72 TRINITY_DN47452_c0_g1_i1:150-608(-)
MSDDCCLFALPDGTEIQMGSQATTATGWDGPLRDLVWGCLKSDNCQKLQRTLSEAASRNQTSVEHLLETSSVGLWNPAKLRARTEEAACLFGAACANRNTGATGALKCAGWLLENFGPHTRGSKEKLGYNLKKAVELGRPAAAALLKKAIKE